MWRFQPRPNHQMRSTKLPTPVPNQGRSWTLGHYLVLSSTTLIMDDVAEFFSPEALRLLEESGIDRETVFQPDKLPVDHTSSTGPAQCEAQTNQNPLSSLQGILGCSTLPLGNLTKPKRKRAKFDIMAHAKVAIVRKKGACLRCRALKIPVGLQPSWLPFINDFS